MVRQLDREPASRRDQLAQLRAVAGQVLALGRDHAELPLALGTGRIKRAIAQQGWQLARREVGEPGSIPEEPESEAAVAVEPVPADGGRRL